jgi:hypothetical protein
MLRSPERWNGLEVQTLARIGVDSISSGVRAVSIDTFRVRALRGVDGSLVMLGLLGAPATAVLMEIGAKGNSETAEAVIEMLGPLAESGDSLVLRYLIGQLDASSGSVRDQAASVLQATGASGLARLDSVRVHGSRRASKAASSAIAGINLGLRSGVVGSCYRLEAGEWTSEGKVGWKGWENPHVVRFTLLPGRIARDGPQWRVVAERGSRESAFGPGSWTFDAKHPTRVTLSWYDGLAGPFLTYEFVGDSVSGSGYFASDVRPPEPYRAKAWAIRVPCTAR